MWELGVSISQGIPEQLPLEQKVQPEGHKGQQCEKRLHDSTIQSLPSLQCCDWTFQGLQTYAMQVLSDSILLALPWN